MTRDEISDLVTKTVGQVDSTSLALCNTFVQRAYEMAWNAELWRDTVTIDTTGTIAQGVNTYTMPTGFDRVISLQLLSGGVPVGFLDPTTSTFILQTEPTALTVQGVPTKYEEFVHTDGSKKIRIFPLPNAAYTFTMSGKRVCPTLGASDSLQIRNIDNAVIALATADMYTRLRQLGKAAEMAKKAGAFIEEARSIEKTQSNQPRTSKQLTVSGNSLAELADAVSARTGQYAPDAVILIKDFLRRNYQQIYDSNLWTESMVEIDIESVTSVLVLPEFVDRVIAIRGNSSLGALSAVQPSVYYSINPWIFEQTGDALAFSYLPPVAVPLLPSALFPSALEYLDLVSSNSSDKTRVFIRGEEGTNVINEETVTLNGTTPVTSSFRYLAPLTIAKSITAGTISVSQHSNSLVLGTILANERERKHIRLQLRPSPTSNVTCKVLGKSRCRPLIQDEDTPMLRDIGNALISLSTADMFAKLGNTQGAQDERSKADQAIKTLIDLERQQGANEFQVVPEVEYCGAGWIDSDAWIVAK